MAHRYTGWLAGQITTFKTWLNNKVNPNLAQASELGNRGQMALRARMALAVFVDDQALYDASLTGMRLQIRSTIGEQTGLVPPPGMGIYRETCRDGDTSPTLTGGDLTHTQLGFQGVLEAATIAKHQGQDLWSYVDPLDNAGIEDLP